MVLRRTKREEGGSRREWEPHGVGVLLVCDDPDAGELLSRLMAADGHSVHRVETAEGAVRHLLEKIRSHPNPPVSEVAVVLLADEMEAEQDAWEAGADGFLARPFHAEQLSAELTGALDRPFADRQAHRDAQLDAS